MVFTGRIYYLKYVRYYNIVYNFETVQFYNEIEPWEKTFNHYMCTVDMTILNVITF
jgi:hypothetical protein